MRAFNGFLIFLVVFFFFLFVTPQWFQGLGAIRLLFSLTVSVIIVMVAFGIIDIFLPTEEEE